jgi:protein-disulfide isomerase
MNQKSLFMTFAGLFLLVFGLATFFYQKNQTSSKSAYVDRHQAALERQSAPVKGPADARVTIVEFFDPACGTCRDFYPLLQQFIEQYPGKVRVMLRYAPLHPGSDQVVKMLEAAHRQDRFWQALELLFNNQQRWIINHTSQPMSARTVLNALDLDQEKLTSDAAGADIARIVEQDMRDAQVLNVRATPEFFVNGRPMPSFGYEQLSQLVAEAVDEAYP